MTRRAAAEGRVSECWTLDGEKEGEERKLERIDPAPRAEDDPAAPRLELGRPCSGDDGALPVYSSSDCSRELSVMIKFPDSTQSTT